MTIKYSVRDQKCTEPLEKKKKLKLRVGAFWVETLELGYAKQTKKKETGSQFGVIWMMNVLMSMGMRVTDVLPPVAAVEGDRNVLLAVPQGKRDESDAHWLAPKVVSSADMIV